MHLHWYMRVDLLNSEQPTELCDFLSYCFALKRVNKMIQQMSFKKSAVFGGNYGLPSSR